MRKAQGERPWDKWQRGKTSNRTRIKGMLRKVDETDPFESAFENLRHQRSITWPVRKVKG